MHKGELYGAWHGLAKQQIKQMENWRPKSSAPSSAPNHSNQQLEESQLLLCCIHKQPPQAEQQLSPGGLRCPPPHTAFEDTLKTA